MKTFKNQHCHERIHDEQERNGLTASLGMTKSRSFESSSPAWERRYLSEGSVEPMIRFHHFSLQVGSNDVVSDMNLEIDHHEITILYSLGDGIRSLLRCINRMNDYRPGVRVGGRLFVQGHDIYDRNFDPNSLRQAVGMVSRLPQPYPMSIYENVTFAARFNESDSSSGRIDRIVKHSLLAAALWGEVRNHLDAPVSILSEGQKQRLAIAQVLATGSKILLMDDPCLELDHIESKKIEKVLHNLKRRHTIIVATHDRRHAERLGGRTAVFQDDNIVSYGFTRMIFQSLPYAI